MKDDRLFFSKDVGNLLRTRFPDGFDKDTLVTYHAMYGKPDVVAGTVLEWEKYKGTYNNYAPSRVVLIGLNRMIVPSNRCDFIHAHLVVLTPQIPKIIIDTAPFIGEPWRLYFHYQVANRFTGFGANYSYPIEGEWLRWFSRDVEECKFTPETLKPLVVDTWSDLPALTTAFKLYEPEQKDVGWYKEVREFEFGRFRAAKTTIANLLREANKHFGLKIGYDSYLDGGVIKVPDVGVYRFMVEENRRRVGIYNLFTVGAVS